MEPLPTTIPTITSIQVENYSILQNSETEVLGDQRKRDNEENRRHEEETLSQIPPQASMPMMITQKTSKRK